MAEIDETNRELLLVWNDRARALGVTPSAVALDDWISPKPKPAALAALAASVLAGPDKSGSAESALDRPAPPRPPRFQPRRRSPRGEFSDDLAGMTLWAKDLEGSYLTIQGPPGTGKTFWGAHIVHSLVTAGRRVGVTAMSHHAIDNLLEEILAVFKEKGDGHDLRAVRKPVQASRHTLAGCQVRHR